MNEPLISSPVVAPAGKKAKVFVSYSRKDMAFAQELVAALVERGFDAFLDKTDIAPGEPWKERLAGLIAAADTIVFAVSPDSVASPICGWELEESARLGKRLLPIVARRIADADAPETLSRLNWIFCTPDDDRAAALASLDEALHTDLAWVREHTQLGEQARRWDTQGRSKGATLRGADLEAAERWLDRRPADANAPTDLHQDFIRASRRAATGRQRSWVAGSIAVAFVALGLAGFAELSRREAQHQRSVAEAARNKAEAATREADAQRKEAVAQKQSAERNLAAAKETVEGLIFNIAQGLRDSAGMRNETIRTILDTVRRTVDGLLSTAPADVELRRFKSVMLNNFAQTFIAAGDVKSALKAAEESLVITETLAAQKPGSTLAQQDLAVSLERVGDVKRLAGDQAGALAAYGRSLDIGRTLAAQAPGNVEAQHAVSISLNKIGEVRRQTGDQAGALADCNQALDIAEKAATRNPGNAEAQHDMLVSLSNIGALKRQMGDLIGALAAYSRGLDIARKLAARDLGNAAAQRDVLVSLGQIGDMKAEAGERAGALAGYTDSLNIARTLVAQDPGDVRLRRELAVVLQRIGDLKRQANDRAGALAAYNEALDITAKLAVRDPANQQIQRDKAFNLNRVGEMKQQAGDLAGALDAYSQGLDIIRTLVAQDAGDAWTQNALAIGFALISGAKTKLGDIDGALAASEEQLAVRRRLALDKTSRQAQGDLVSALGSTAFGALLAKDYAKALALSEEAVALAPEQLWLQTNRAHALMMLGRTKEARALYLKHLGKVLGDKPWEQTVENDFAELRKVGVTNPFMNEIEADFAESK